MISLLSRYNTIKKYITKDGSEIREMIHPQIHGNKEMSVAEALVKSGRKTLSHIHQESEEIYIVVAGEGVMRRNDEVFAVGKGVSVVILPGQEHSLENTGKEDLVVICCCAPAYGHTDTILTEVDNK